MSEHMHGLWNQNSSGTCCVCDSYKEGAASVASMCTLSEAAARRPLADVQFFDKAACPLLSDNSSYCCG